MPTGRTYSSPGAFRQALEERLKQIAQQEETDFQRLCRQVAFDRFLARLVANNWILKGGYAMELRFVAARSTRDLDFTLRAGDTDSALDQLQRAGARELADFFSFRVGEPMMNLDAAPYGGARYPVEARLDGRAFIRFHVDVGIGDVILEPIETIRARDWLAFADIPSPSIAMIAREQQFAEKIHAYTMPRPSPNSRVRDLVDLYLLIASDSLNPSRCSDAVRRTFERRKTHDIPQELIAPSTAWNRPFQALAEECGITVECKDAFQTLLGFWAAL